MFQNGAEASSFFLFGGGVEGRGVCALAAAVTGAGGGFQRHPVEDNERERRNAGELERWVEGSPAPALPRLSLLQNKARPLAERC